MAADNEQFYSRLPVNQIPLRELLNESHLFFRVPDNWHIIITDVKGSTQAVADGMHETVNLIATGSIVAVLNIAYKAGITVPFFFGGDGATFIVPDKILVAAKNALVTHQQNTLRNFNLNLRVGHVPVSAVYEHNHALQITKLKTTDVFSIPVLLGNGLSYAEKIIKGEDYILEDVTPSELLDLSGMQCRWDRIKPPLNFDEVVSLLVVAREGVPQHEVFREVMTAIDSIYGEPQQRKPITVPRLKLKTTLAKVGKEMRVRLGGYRPLYLFKTWFTTLLGTFYFRTRPGKTYLSNLVDMSDTLVIDGRINTVISGTVQQREQLQEQLALLESRGLLYFGLFVSRESIMSCYVRSMDDDKHVHFVDGAEGGYTRAAAVLKQKLRSMPS